MDVINNGNWTEWSAILVWNHTCDFKSNSRCALVRFWNHAYDFRPNCTPLSSITIINRTTENRSHCKDNQWFQNECYKVCNHTSDKQIGLPLRGRPILLSLVWLQTELDFTQSYYHYLFKDVRAHCYCASLVRTLFIGHARATSFSSARTDSK